MTTYTNHTDDNDLDVEVKCYEDTSNFDTICLGSTEVNGFDICAATLNKQDCRSCRYVPQGLCYGHSSTYGGSSGYKIDCSNINYKYDNAKVCGNEITATHYSSSSGNYYHSSSSSGDDIGPILGIFFGIFIVAIRLLACMVRTDNNQSTRRPIPTNATRRAPNARYVRVNRSGPSRNVELVLIPIASPQVIAKETIQDGHDQFEFFSAYDQEDLVAEKLKESIQSDNWESIRDILQSMKEVENRKESNERAFYFSLIVDQISESWPKSRTQEMVSFSPVLDAWIAAEPESVDCRILQASTGTSWAWHARSATLAGMVAKRQWELFFSRLNDATIKLNLARESCPKDPLIYSTGIPIAKGLQGKNKDAISVEQCLERVHRKRAFVVSSSRLSFAVLLSKMARFA